MTNLAGGPPSGQTRRHAHSDDGSDPVPVGKIPTIPTPNKPSGGISTGKLATGGVSSGSTPSGNTAIGRRPTWIPVVTALIRKGDQVLVGQRPPGHTLAGQWEFPGGKIEKGEAPEVALKRELFEELGIEAEIGELQLAASHAYGDTCILILFYDVKFWKGEPKLQQHTDLRWIKPSDFRDLPIPEANRRVLDRLIQILK